MAKIYQLPTPIPGTVGVFPSQKFCLFGDDLSTVTTAGYLNQAELESFPINETDILFAFYNYDLVSQSGEYAVFTVSISGAGVITLAQAGVAGSGTVNPSTANYMSYYAATGDAVSGLPTANSAMLVTNASGVPSMTSSMTNSQVVVGASSGTPRPMTLTAGTNMTVATDFEAGTVTFSASGAGTVSSGLQNQISYYANNGTVVSGLATANSGVLVTNGSGVPSVSTTLPSNLAMQTPASIVLTNATGLPVTGLSVGTNSAMIATDGVGVASALGPMADGEIIIGHTGDIPVRATLTAGANITITNGAGSITISAASVSGFSWEDVSGTSQNMVVNKGYVASNTGQVTLTLPVTSVVGDRVAVQDSGLGGWKVAQNAGQRIRSNAASTTAGTGGYLESGQPFDVVYLLCTVANTEWAYNGGFGNYSYI
jgi:hypothetical protein